MAPVDRYSAYDEQRWGHYAQPPEAWAAGQIQGYWQEQNHRGQGHPGLPAHNSDGCQADSENNRWPSQ